MVSLDYYSQTDLVLCWLAWEMGVCVVVRRDVCRKKKKKKNFYIFARLTHSKKVIKLCHFKKKGDFNWAATSGTPKMNVKLLRTNHGYTWDERYLNDSCTPDSGIAYKMNVIQAIFCSPASGTPKMNVIQAIFVHQLLSCYWSDFFLHT